MKIAKGLKNLLTINKQTDKKNADRQKLEFGQNLAAGHPTLCKTLSVRTRRDGLRPNFVQTSGKKQSYKNL